MDSFSTSSDVFNQFSWLFVNVLPNCSRSEGLDSNSRFSINNTITEYILNLLSLSSIYAFAVNHTIVFLFVQPFLPFSQLFHKHLFVFVLNEGVIPSALQFVFSIHIWNSSNAFFASVFSFQFLSARIRFDSISRYFWISLSVIFPLIQIGSICSSMARDLGFLLFLSSFWSPESLWLDVLLVSAPTELSSVFHWLWLRWVLFDIHINVFNDLIFIWILFRRFDCPLRPKQTPNVWQPHRSGRDVFGIWVDFYLIWMFCSEIYLVFTDWYDLFAVIHVIKGCNHWKRLTTNRNLFSERHLMSAREESGNDFRVRLISILIVANIWSLSERGRSLWSGADARP